MKPSDPSITWLEEKPLGLAERLANSPALLKSLKAVIAKVEDEGSSSRG